MIDPNAELRPDEPADVYHSNVDHWGHSMVEAVRKALCRIPLVCDPDSVRNLTTAQVETFANGNALHTRVLEPEHFDSRYERGPVNDKRLKAWKEAEKATPEGKTLLRPSRFDELEIMGEGIRCHPVLGPALERGGLREASFYWTDPVTGLRMKCRPDFHMPPSENDPGFCFDLKGTRDLVDPETAAKVFNDYGYHRQQAHYEMGFEAKYGARPGAFIFGLVSKEAPYEVAAYQLDDTSIELGQEQKERDLRRIADAIEAKSFSQPWNTDIATLVLPTYAHFKD